MAWFEDLAGCSYFGAEFSHLLRAVGWLEKGRPFPTGAVDGRVYSALVEMSKGRPWQPVVTAGYHACDLCVYSADASGTQNLFIPGDGFVFVSPGLVVHYMNAHGYAPPLEFCHAVLECPPMRSMGYLKALLANGGKPLVEMARA